MKVWKKMFLLLLLFSLAGCKNAENKVEEGKGQETGIKEDNSYHEIETKLTVEETKDGVVFVYGKEKAEGESSIPYQITQLPFPTFWGGAAYSIITPTGDLYLIDGGFQGEDYERISSYIEEQGGFVKAWILTHPHVDHIGAFLDYMQHNSNKVETVYYSPFTKEFFEEEEDPEIYAILNNPNAILFYEFLEVMEATKGHITYLPMTVGDIIPMGELTLECFFSFDPKLRDVNGNSLVFTLTYKDFCLSLTADMTEETFDKMKAGISQKSSFLHPDILQIPHHGYMAGIASDILYRETTPEYVLLDCTREEFENNSVNIQNHIEMIEKLGIKVIKRFTARTGNKIFLYTDTYESTD